MFLHIEDAYNEIVLLSLGHCSRAEAACHKDDSVETPCMASLHWFVRTLSPTNYLKICSNHYHRSKNHRGVEIVPRTISQRRELSMQTKKDPSRHGMNRIRLIGGKGQKKKIDLSIGELNPGHLRTCSVTSRYPNH